MTNKIFLPLLIIANALIPIALLVFATGFFPYKPFIPGQATFRDGDHGLEKMPPPFGKVIFMVVDALRRFRSTVSTGLKWLIWLVILSTDPIRASRLFRGGFELARHSVRH